MRRLGQHAEAGRVTGEALRVEHADRDVARLPHALGRLVARAQQRAPVPCPTCGGTCAPGECPFAGAGNPFATRWNADFQRSNRSSHPDGPFGPWPEATGGGHNRRRSSAASAGRPSAMPHATFSFREADEIFRAFFGGAPKQ